jgi:hypothetical protein
LSHIFSGDKITNLNLIRDLIYRKMGLVWRLQVPWSEMGFREGVPVVHVYLLTKMRSYIFMVPNMMIPSHLMTGPSSFQSECTRNCAFDLGAYWITPWSMGQFQDVSARWIWSSSDARNSAPAKDTYFVKTLYLDPSHTCASKAPQFPLITVNMFVIADDSATVYLNDRVVQTFYDGWSGSASSHQANTSLRVGQNNTIKILANSFGGPAGLIFALFCDGTSTLLVHSDSTWCSGATCTDYVLNPIRSTRSAGDHILSLLRMIC